ncbi:hypothetical protein ES332_D11G213300v1 [Gossypium tomentosum]|nr:hypothetical protein ES332_D11G213300v1 [Gossypium tomentosum]
MQNYVIIGVRYKSPTLAFALANLIPAFTFLLGVIFRLSEARLGWKLVGVISHYPSVLSTRVRGVTAWMLSLDIELIYVVYSALFGNVVTISVQAWCIWCKGPVFVATFKPLSIFVATFYIVSFLGFIFLGDDGEEGIGGRGGEGKGGEVCKKVKGLMIGGGMENGISVKSIMENNNSITDVTENG